MECNWKIIKTSLDLPPIGARVIASDGNWCGEAYMGKKDQWFRPNGFPWKKGLRTKVIKWMPMPEP